HDRPLVSVERAVGVEVDPAGEGRGLARRVDDRHGKARRGRVDQGTGRNPILVVDWRVEVVAVRVRGRYAVEVGVDPGTDGQLLVWFADRGQDVTGAAVVVERVVGVRRVAEVGGEQAVRAVVDRQGLARQKGGDLPARHPNTEGLAEPRTLALREDSVHIVVR